MKVIQRLFLFAEGFLLVSIIVLIETMKRVRIIRPPTTIFLWSLWARKIPMRRPGECSRGYRMDI